MTNSSYPKNSDSVVPNTLASPAPTDGMPPKPPVDWRKRIKRFAIVSFVIIDILILIGMAGVIGVYAYYSQSLPPAEQLAGRRDAQSTKIFDRNGESLYEVFDPNGGRRTNVPITSIPLVMKQAIIATEDPSFYTNIGIDPRGIARSVYYIVTTGAPTGGGGSTITQQLVRNTLITAEPTVQRKIREWILAYEVTRKYSKDQILEWYLNTIFYGNLAYGIQAASEGYFNKSVQNLSLGEASLLAGLPQAPAMYDPCENPDAAIARQKDVLRLMIQAGYINDQQAASASTETTQLLKSETFSKRCDQGINFQAPHFVVYVRQQLEALYGPEVVYKGGLQVTTTLDMKLQKIAEDEARKQIAALDGKNVTNAALVTLNPKTGEILAMLGSVDFFDKKIDGQVNVAIRLRQPGSSIKPLTYIAAFQKGWTPATVITDIKTKFPIPGQPDYEPTNYDLREHGLVSARTALASSYNIPAVKALQFIGVQGLLDTGKKLGITTFKDASNYGLALTLGGGEVQLLELTGAYAVFANNGIRVPSTPFLKIVDANGKALIDIKAKPIQGTQVVDARYAYEITSILSDVSARAPAFGTGGALKLTRPAAAKTGTTNDWRDNWTIGYTPDLVTGVWVGNANNSEMEHISGVSGAGPLWHNFMERALAGTPVNDFLIPPGMVRAEICSESGLIATELCPAESRRQEIFLSEQAPTQTDNVWQKLRIDRTNGLLGNVTCPELSDEKIFAVYPADARQWAIEHNIPQPPTDKSPNCPDPTPTPIGGIRPNMYISSPSEGSRVSGNVQFVGTAVMGDFDHYILQWGFGNDPKDWIQFANSPVSVQNGTLAVWDSRRLPDGDYTIRIEMVGKSGQAYGGRLHLTVANTPATPTRILPTATLIPASPTATFAPATATRTRTPVTTATNVPTIATATRTATPVTPTATSVPATATTTRTATPVTPTATSVPATATATRTATPVTPTTTLTPSPSPTKKP